MATCSFDERVIITDTETIKMMKEDLETITVTQVDEKSFCTYDETVKNAERWVSNFLNRATVL